MLDAIKTVLILAPHPDDAEFGLGGTIAKLLESGKEIHVAVFSMCEKSTPQGFPVGIIQEEMYRSFDQMSIDRAHIHAFDFEVRIFPQLRQEILENLILLKKKIQPDLVFVPCSTDIHQDHQTIHNEGLRAFKHSNLLGYELPWNNFEYKSQFYMPLSIEHIDKKIEALNTYKSQQTRDYLDFDFIKGLAKLRGTQINTEYAESFELIRWIAG